MSVTSLNRKSSKSPHTEKSVHGDGKMLAKKIILGLVLLATATTLITTGAFANAPGGAYIQCDGGPSSPVRCTPDSW
jgi:hypothetical protein